MLMNERMDRLKAMEDTMRQTLENQDYMRDQQLQMVSQEMEKQTLLIQAEADKQLKEEKI